MILYYLTDSVLKDSYAETIHIDELCSNMGALGNNVTLYAPFSHNFHASKRYEVNYISTPRSLISTFFQIQLIFKLLYDIKTKRPDIIYSRHSLLLFIPALVNKLYKIPVVLEVNGILIEESKKVDLSKTGRVLAKLGVFKIIELFNIKNATKIIVVAKGIKEYITKEYKISGNLINVVTNGVDINIFKPILQTPASLKSNTINQEIIVGYIGSLYSWQGIKYIIEAAKIVCEKYKNVQFKIVGSGREANHLHTLINNFGLSQKVELLPAVPHNIVPRYINSFDICLSYPSKFRASTTSPFKIYEYLACGRAVVSSDIPGMREEFGNVIEYSKPESPETLAKVLISLIKNKDRRQTLGKNGRKFVENGHSWRSVVKKILFVCEDAVNEVSTNRSLLS